MPSYYNTVTGTIDAGRTARSSDIHLIQSSIQQAMRTMISDMFGAGFILGESENALKLYSTSEHRDQYNENNEDNIRTISFLDRYFKQPIIIEKSSIETINIQVTNVSNITTTIYAEIRNTDGELLQESNVVLAPNAQGDFQTIGFHFDLHHLPLGIYYFILRPVDISATDLTINGDETPYDTITSEMFQVRYDTEGGYTQGLQASMDGSTYLDAKILIDDIGYTNEGDIIDINPDLIFEHIYSSGNTYLITKGSAVVLGEKVYTLDTHVTIDGPSPLGDRTDLVTLTSDGRLNVIKGEVYNGAKKYPNEDTGLKIAYITTYRNNTSTWICPKCNNTNSISTQKCIKCGNLAPTNVTINKVPSIEQADDNGITRHRDVIERLRRLEKKVNYQEQRNSPMRIKYNCEVDPILANNGVDDDASIRGEGSYNVSSTNDGSQTTITSNVGLNYAWSIIKNNYTYNSTTKSSENAKITLYDTVTTKTKVNYKSNKLKPGELLIQAEATELPDVNSLTSESIAAKPLSGLKMKIQIKKGGTLKKTYDVTTNKQGQVKLSIWNAKLSAGKYNVYLIYDDTSIKGSLTIKDANSVNVNNINIKAHSDTITITKNASGSVTKSLPDGVIPGDDSFYKEHMKVDTENGIVQVSKISNKGKEWTTNSLLKDKNTFQSHEVQYKINFGNSLTSEYPLLHFTLPRDTTIKTITPYIAGFQNMKSFGILIFKNDTVFDMIDNTRQVFTKYISKHDARFPTQYNSGEKSLKDLAKQSGDWKVLKKQVSFDVNQDFDAGMYTLMVYGKLENNKKSGIIKIKQYHTYENTSKYGIAAKSLGTSQLSLIHMDTSNLSDWSWDVAIEQKTYTYYDKGILISKPINTVLPVKACNITKNLTIPDGCDAELWVANNGSNYIRVNGNSVKFKSEGNSFRWKLVFYATAEKTPKLSFDPKRQSAISFTLATNVNYVEYEDYHQCYETPLLNANAITRTFTASPAQDTFSSWEFARVYMEDEELQSKIDICISYAYDNYTTNVETPKNRWNDIFFNTIFANLSLDDFSRDSVDYSNYAGDVEYDEYNFPFNMNSDYVMHYTGGNALASPDTTSELYEYGNINNNQQNINDNFTTQFINESYEYYDNDDIGITHKYAGMHMSKGPYYQAVYTPTTEYTRNDVIAGVTFPSGLDIDENKTYFTIGIYAGLNTANYSNDSNYSDNEGNFFYPPGTFEIVVSTNPYGDVDTENAATGKSYVINKKLEASTYARTVSESNDATLPSLSLSYNEVTVNFLEDLEGFETTGVYAIGIRAIDPENAMKNGDIIGIGRITTGSYNRRPYVKYMYTGSWERLGWKRLSSNKACKAFSIYNLGRKNADVTSSYKVFYPIDNTDDDIKKASRKISDFNDSNDNLNQGRISVWQKYNSSYRRLESGNKGHSGTGSITRNGTTITTKLDGQGTFTTNDSGNPILFDLPADVTGNLFKIDTDIPFTIYDLIDIEYYMFCEHVTKATGDANGESLKNRLITLDSNVHNFYENSNVRNDNDYYYITDGSFSKGEIILDFYETRDINNAQPVESFPLPSWGRVATRSNVSDKTVHAWFKKHTASTKIKCIVLRRANPRKVAVPHIRLILNNILLFNADEQLALGPQMQLRIYPNTMNNYANTKIRKYGAVYRLK